MSVGCVSHVTLGGLWVEGGGLLSECWHGLTKPAGPVWNAMETDLSA